MTTNEETAALIAEARAHDTDSNEGMLLVSRLADCLADLTKELDRARSDAGWAANMDRQGGA